jgi:hypothetical protein
MSSCMTSQLSPSNCVYEYDVVVKIPTCVERGSQVWSPIEDHRGELLKDSSENRQEFDKHVGGCATRGKDGYQFLQWVSLQQGGGTPYSFHMPDLRAS